MIRLLLAATAATALLSACGQKADTNKAMTEANASGNAASAAVNNAVAGSNAAPLDKAAALKVIKDRHGKYEQIGKAMKATKRALDSANPDLATVRSSAATIAGLAPQVPSWFPRGTGVETGAKTGAKAEIWQQGNVFAHKARDFDNAAKAFQAAANGNDVGRIKSSFADLGKSCKSCHDQFRKEDHGD